MAFIINPMDDLFTAHAFGLRVAVKIAIKVLSDVFHECHLHVFCS